MSEVSDETSSGLSEKREEEIIGYAKLQKYEENAEEHNEENAEEHNEEEEEKEEEEEEQEEWQRQFDDLQKFKENVPQSNERLHDIMKNYKFYLELYRMPSPEHKQIMNYLRRMQYENSQELDDEVNDLILKYRQKHKEEWQKKNDEIQKLKQNLSQSNESHQKINFLLLALHKEEEDKE